MTYLQDAAASTSETSSQHSARGGEASTSEAAAQPEQPIGNEHTAKWKLYTTQGRKLVAQVTLRLLRCVPDICLIHQAR